MFIIFTKPVSAGFVGSQTVNKTEEELSIVERNQTFSKSIVVNSKTIFSFFEYEKQLLNFVVNNSSDSSLN